MISTRISLLERLRDTEDDSAWCEFDASYRELIVRCARGCGLQQADAEDVHQMVMMSLSRSIEGFAYDPRRGRFRDYVGRAVRNEVARFFRRPPPWAVDLRADSVGDRSSDLERRWEREWRMHHLRRAMRWLRERHDPLHVAVIDALLAGEDAERAAARLRLSVEGVYKIRQRVSRRLEERVLMQIREEDSPVGRT